MHLIFRAPEIINTFAPKVLSLSPRASTQSPWLKHSIATFPKSYRLLMETTLGPGYKTFLSTEVVLPCHAHQRALAHMLLLEFAITLHSAVLFLVAQTNMCHALPSRVNHTMHFLSSIFQRDLSVTSPGLLQPSHLCVCYPPRQPLPQPWLAV